LQIAILPVAFLLVALAPSRATGTDIGWGSYIGGEGHGATEVRDIATDPTSGNVWIAGRTYSYDFPVPGSYQTDGPGFIMEVSASGECLWGSRFYAIPQRVAVDGMGNVWIAHYADWGLGVTRLDAAEPHTAHRFIDTPTINEWRGIAADSAGNAYVSCSTWYPIFTGGAPQNVNSWYLIKLDQSGNIAWCNLIVRNNDQRIGEVAVDSTGDVYLSGGLAQFAAPEVLTYGANAYGPCVVKLSPSGEAIWVSYAGEGLNTSPALACNSSGTVCIAGPHGDSRYNGCYLAQMSPDGQIAWLKAFTDVRLTVPGVLGGGSPYNIAVDSNEACWLSAVSSSPGWATPDGYCVSPPGAFVTRFDNQGLVSWGTFIESADLDLPTCISAGVTEDVWVSGDTLSSALPTPGGFNTDLGISGQDGFAVRIGDGEFTIATKRLPDAFVNHSYHTVVRAVSGIRPYTWSIIGGQLPDGLSLTAAGDISGTPTALGTFGFTVQARDAGGLTRSRDLAITVTTVPPVIGTTSLPAGTVGHDYSATLACSTDYGPFFWTIASGVLPDGLSLDGGSGVISGTPQAAGTFAFTVQVADSLAKTARRALSIKVVDTAAPAIETTSLPDGAIFKAYSATLACSGDHGPFTWSITSGVLPEGLSLYAGSGVISGTPQNAGTFPITVQVRDSVGKIDTADLSITIADTPAPVIETASLPGGTVDRPYSAALVYSGDYGPFTWKVASGALPAGISLDGGSGAISGTPQAVGTFSFTAQVTDSRDKIGLKGLSIAIADTAPPVITTTLLHAGIVGTAYTAALACSGDYGPFSWSIVDGALPDGLSLSSGSGVISGTPQATGTFSFTVQAADTRLRTSRKGLSIRIADAASPVIETTSLPAGTFPQPYSATLVCSGNYGPFTWSLASGALPGGISLNASSGAISGTPQAAGAFPITVQVKDSRDKTDTAGLTLTIADTDPPVILTTSLPNGTVTLPYAATLTCSGDYGPFTWSIASGTLPSGLSLDASSGVVSGTPTIIAAQSFTARVRDSLGKTARKALTIIVVDTMPPAIATTSLPDGVIGEAYGVTLICSGQCPAFTWDIISGSLPSGLSLSPGAGVISGTPAAAASFPITVRVRDSRSKTAAKALSVTVAARPPVISTQSLGAGTVGLAYSASLTCAGAYPPFTWSVVSGSLPDGLSLDAFSGAISGTPREAASCSFTVLC